MIENLKNAEIFKYMRENDLECHPETFWATDVFIDNQTGRIIRSIEPVEVFIVKNNNADPVYIAFAMHLKGKKGNILKKVIPYRSSSNGYYYSYLKLFDSYEEAKQCYLMKCEEQMNEFQKYISILNSNAEYLKRTLLK